MNNIPIFLDLDEVIVKFLDKLLSDYNLKYNQNIKLEDIKTWNLKDYIGNEGVKIFQQPGFFKSLEPMENAIEVIKKLYNEKQEMFIISSPMNEYSVFEKYLWVKEYLPFFPIGNLILVGNKGDLLSKINEGILFDDCPEYTEKFKGINFIMDRPYNRNVKSDYRVDNWNDFYTIVSKG